MTLRVFRAQGQRSPWKTTSSKLKLAYGPTLLSKMRWISFGSVFHTSSAVCRAPRSSFSGWGRSDTRCYLRSDFDWMAIRWRNIRLVTCFVHRRRSTRMDCTASTWICHKCYPKHLRIHDSKPTLGFKISCNISSNNYLTWFILILSQCFPALDQFCRPLCIRRIFPIIQNVVFPQEAKQY